MKKLFIIGNVGKDPESLLDKNNNQYTAFSVAVNSGTKENPRTDWIEVSCSFRLAEIAKLYVKKGMRIFVEGNPIFSAYMNKDNQPLHSVRIFANNIEFLSNKNDNDGSKQVGSPHLDNDNQFEHKQIQALNNDDMPF